MALALALSGLTGNLSVLGSGPIVPVVVVYAAVGVVVARRQPGNPIGWILITFIVIVPAERRRRRVCRAVLPVRPPRPAAGRRGRDPAAFVGRARPIVLFPVAILLFPDGRLASRRWRWALRVYAVAGALASMAVFGPGRVGRGQS